MLVAAGCHLHGAVISFVRSRSPGSVAITDELFFGRVGVSNGMLPAGVSDKDAAGPCNRSADGLVPDVKWPQEVAVGPDVTRTILTPDTVGMDAFSTDQDDLNDSGVGASVAPESSFWAGAGLTWLACGRIGFG
jgi:hypothetical protein